jgi:hypothetical protein
VLGAALRRVGKAPSVTVAFEPTSLSLAHCDGAKFAWGRGIAPDQGVTLIATTIQMCK